MSRKAKSKKQETQEKIMVRFKAWWKPEEESKLYFDTEEEAKEWIQKLGDSSGIIEVKRVLGVLINKSQSTGLFTAKNQKVWVPIEEEEKVI